MGQLDCGLKLIFYICNLFYVIIGTAFVVLGIVIIYAQKELEDHLTKDVNFDRLPAIIIPIGVVFLCIALCGYVVWCLFTSSCCIMTIYTIIIGILLSMSIIASIFVLFVNPEEDETRKMMKYHQANYNDNNSSKKYWDDFQNFFICCGVENRTDWLEYMPEPPKSCCHKYPDKNPYTNRDEPKYPSCDRHNKERPYLQYIGCFTKIVKMQKKFYITLIILACIACCSQGGCFILSIIMLAKRNIPINPNLSDLNINRTHK